MSQSCVFFSVLETVFPWLCALAFFRAGRPFPLMWSCVAGLTFYQVYLFLVSLTLGHLGLLGGGAYRACFAVASGAALLVALYKLPAIVSELRAIRYKPNWRDIPVILCILSALQLIHYQWHKDWTWGTPGYDGMHYHIPRALQWLWHGDFRPYWTPIHHQLGFPYGADGTLLPPVLNGCGWLGGAYTTMVLTIGASVATALISRALGIGMRGSILAGLVFLSCPTVGLRMLDVSTDMGAIYPIIAAVAFALTTSSLEKRLFLFPALVGLGGAIKQYAVFAAPLIAIVLFAPSFFRIIKSPKAIAAGVAGIAVGVFFLFLSMWPIYAIFGDISAGGHAYTLSNIGRGWYGIRETLVVNFLQWSLEPLALLPVPQQQSVVVWLGIDQVWAYFRLPGTLHTVMPDFNRERMRGLTYSIVFLPWLVMAVKRGYRIATAVGILALACMQMAPLAVNPVGARFTILIMAAYSVLWGARAAVSPVIVGCLALLTLRADVNSFQLGSPLREYWPNYLPQHDNNRDLKEKVGEETVLLLGRHMSLDAEIAGRLGQVRYEYVACPVEGDWVAHLTKLGSQSRWFMMPVSEVEINTGPDFRTILGPPCPRLKPSVLKDALTAAGWRFERKVVRDYELWTHQ